MTCEQVTERLDDYVDGALDEADYQEMELHLSACATCREKERLLRAVLAHAASAPREVMPQRDLWPEIQARLGGQRKVLPFAQRMFSPWILTAAAAAAVVVAIASGIGIRVFPHPGQGLPPAPTATVEPVAATNAGLEQAEAEYARANAALLQALEARRGSLPPATLAAVEQNMRSIDAALDEVRAALRKDPGNRQLAYLLTSTHQKKVDVLSRVVRLSTRL
jgi:Putative zinc-finger